MVHIIIYKVIHPFDNRNERLAAVSLFEPRNTLRPEHARRSVDTALRSHITMLTAKT